MADLVITLPKKVRWRDYERELAAVKDSRSVLNFRVPSCPKDARAGDRCYIVHNGYVQGFMRITDIVQRDGFTCDTSGVKWPAGYYVQRSGAFVPVVTALAMKGFQGFRYAPTNWRAILH